MAHLSSAPPPSEDQTPAPKPEYKPLLESAGFFASLKESWQTLFGKQSPALRLDSQPVQTDVLIEEPSVWKSLAENLRAVFHPEQLPPLQLESKPIPVKDIWAKDERKALSGTASFLIHIAVMALLAIPLFNHSVRKAIQQNVTQIFVPTENLSAKMAPKRMGGGGGHHDPTPVTKGKLPKLERAPKAPPVIKPPDVQPKLPVAPAIQVQPDAKLANVNLPVFGSPTGVKGPPSLGNGHGNGIGSGNGAGLGPGNGWNTGGGNPSEGGALSPPRVIYQPDPEYSDEARKAKFQGQVELLVTIGTDGRVHDVRVSRPLGLGLDEKAVEAVKLWRFEPARTKDGKPVQIAANIEVNFRLY